jgi:hypothetical protein
MSGSAPSKCRGREKVEHCIGLRLCILMKSCHRDALCFLVMMLCKAGFEVKKGLKDKEAHDQPTSHAEAK